MLEFEKEVLEIAFRRQKELQAEMDRVNKVIQDCHAGESAVMMPELTSDKKEMILSTVGQYPGLKVGEIARLLTERGTPIESNEVSRLIFQIKMKGLVKEKGWRYWIAPKEKIVVEEGLQPKLIKKDNALHSGNAVQRF